MYKASGKVLQLSLHVTWLHVEPWHLPAIGKFVEKAEMMRGWDFCKRNLSKLRALKTCRSVVSSPWQTLQCLSLRVGTSNSAISQRPVSSCGCACCNGSFPSTNVRCKVPNGQIQGVQTFGGWGLQIHTICTTFQLHVLHVLTRVFSLRFQVYSFITESETMSNTMCRRKGLLWVVNPKFGS